MLKGRRAKARQLFEESLALRRTSGDGHSIGHILRFLGEIAEEQGETEQARVYYAEALVMLRDAWDVNRLAAVLRGVAALALMAGDPARALRIAGAVHVVHATHGTRIYLDVAPALKLWARTSWEDIRDAAQQAMSPADAAAAWAEGQAMAWRMPRLCAGLDGDRTRAEAGSGTSSRERRAGRQRFRGRSPALHHRARGTWPGMIISYVP